MADEHVVIVGGGFSGTLLAINLLRHDGPRATLIERRDRMARGVAYSVDAPELLLNVRAGNMSALPDRPDHFVRWLERRGGPATGFVPRRVYGDYLGELLGETIAAAGGRLTSVAGEAIDVAPGADGATVHLAGGGRIAADRVALAPGNLAPLAPAGIAHENLPDGAYVDNPWRAAFGDGLGRDDIVLVLGTGLTMVDVALRLDAQGFAGRIVALSRRGLAPRAHNDAPSPAMRSDRPPARALALLRALRTRAGEVDWRVAVDELRPFTQLIWRAMDLAERERFLRHVRPWWDVHRHRVAPEVAATIARMQAEGRLAIVAGKVTASEATPDGRVALRYRPRGAESETRLTVSRIVNGTGPQGDLTRTTDPLLRSLTARGLLRPDPLRIGIDVDQDSRAVDASGASSDRLLVLGPMTRGAFWEIVAVPDIRRQAWSVARRLANAHWVEGEGL